MNDYLILASLVICHILGDFYLQSKAMVDAKRFGSEHKPLVVHKLQLGVIPVHLLHMFIHALLMSLLLFLLQAMDVILLSHENIWLTVAIIALGHLVIDLIKSALSCFSKSNDNAAITLVVDQIAHLVWIFAVWAWLFDHLNHFSDMITVNHFIIVGAYLLILKPTSIREGAYKQPVVSTTAAT